MIGSEYAAGIVDGEGTITINSHKNIAQSQIVVSVAMADPTVPYELQKKYGGRISINKGKKENHNDSIRWAVSSRLAEEAIKDFIDFLLVKRDQAEIALIYQSTVSRSTRKLSEETRTIRQTLLDNMRLYNRRGKQILL